LELSSAISIVLDSTKFRILAWLRGLKKQHTSNMKYCVTRIIIFCTLACGLLTLQNCEKVYDQLDEDDKWSKTYIPVHQNGVQVGLIAMSQRVITDMDRNLDIQSKISFTLQDDQNNPIWDDPNVEMLIQIFDSSPDLSAEITHEIFIPVNSRGIQDTLSILRSGFSRAFQPEQVRIVFLKSSNGSSNGGRYIGNADGKRIEFVGDSLVDLEHLFICPFNATVTADGFIEIRFVNYPSILGITGRVIDGTFNGQIVLPEEIIQVETTHFPPGSLTSIVAVFDSAGVAALDGLNRIYLDFQPR
jgi:hypothetical protein